MGRFELFISELKRRRVIRALLGWGIFSFAVLQVYEPVMHGLHLPEWTLSVVVLVLAAGFPATVALAWVFDLKASGIERTPPAKDEAGAAAHLRPRLALLLGLGLAAAAPGLVYFFVWPSVGRGAAAAPAPAPGSVIATAPSIAVLPFADMSPQKDQEYFSDGIAEEILNALAQVDGLRVVGRTSSFAFKGKNEDLAAIAQKLHAATVLEGSVRKEGSRVRITAQLINAADGYHLWSQTFDRELTGVFAVQEEIARAVTRALALKLLPERGAAAGRPATDPEAYRLYLLARQVTQLGTVEAYDRAIAELRQAARLAPTDARVRAQLAFLVWQRHVIGTGDMTGPNQEALAQADQAVALGPELPEAYFVRGLLRHLTTWDWAAARTDEERGLALAPGDVTGLASFARLQASTGHLPEALAIMTRVIEADPLSPTAWLWMGVYQSAGGHPDQGEVSFQRGLDLAPSHAYLLRELGFALLLQGKAAEALALAERHPVAWMRQLLEVMAHHQLGDEAASQRALQPLLRVGVPAAYQLGQAYAWRGEQDRAFEWLERGYATNDSGMRFTIHDPMLRGLRGDRRFAALLRKMNLSGR